jgi:hypothetical protein
MCRWDASRSSWPRSPRRSARPAWAPGRRRRRGTVAGIVGTVTPSGGLLADSSAYDDVVRAPAAMVVVAGRTAQGRRVVRGIRSDLRGRFRVRLPVGTYTFGLRVGSRLRTPVRVRAGRTARVRLTQYPPATGKRVTL